MTILARIRKCHNVYAALKRRLGLTLCDDSGLRARQNSADSYWDSQPVTLALRIDAF